MLCLVCCVLNLGLGVVTAGLWMLILWDHVEKLAAKMAARVLTKEALSEVRVSRAKLRFRSVTLGGVEVGNRDGRPSVAVPFFCRVGVFKAKCPNFWSALSLVGMKRFGGLRRPFVVGFAVRDVAELKLTNIQVVFDDGVSVSDAPEEEETREKIPPRRCVPSCKALCTARKLAHAVRTTANHQKAHIQKKIEKEANFERQLQSVWNAVTTRRRPGRRRSSSYISDDVSATSARALDRRSSSESSSEENGRTNYVDRLKRMGSVILKGPDYRALRRLSFKFRRVDEAARQEAALARRRKVYRPVVRVGRIVVDGIHLTLRGQILTLTEPLELPGLVGDSTEVRARIITGVLNALFASTQKKKPPRSPDDDVLLMPPPDREDMNDAFSLLSSSDDDEEGPLTFFRRGLRESDDDAFDACVDDVLCTPRPESSLDADAGWSPPPSPCSMGPRAAGSPSFLYRRRRRRRLPGDLSPFSRLESPD